MCKRINQHEKSYCTSRKQLPSVASTFHSYLYHHEILLRTGNMDIKWPMEKPYVRASQINDNHIPLLLLTMEGDTERP